MFQPTGVLILAQDITSAGIVNPTAASFTGEIGQVGVWNRILSLQERVSLTANCSTNLTGILLEMSIVHLLVASNFHHVIGPILLQPSYLNANVVMSNVALFSLFILYFTETALHNHFQAQQKLESELQFLPGNWPL